MIVKATKYVHLPLVFAKNDLIEVVESVDLENTDRAGLRYFLEISVRKALNSSEFVVFRTLKGSEKPPISYEDSLFFEGFQPFVNEYLNGLLAYTAPSLSKVVRAAKTTTAFLIRSWAERDGVVVEDSEVIGEVSWAIKAALGENDFPSYKNLFFSTYMDEKLPFLTHQPNNMVVSPSQAVNLSWICNLAPVPTSFKTVVTAKCADGSAHVFDRNFVAAPSQYGVYHLPVGFAQMGLDIVDLDTPIVQYEVLLVDDEGKQMTEIRKFLVDYGYYEFERFLIFSNSLGGFDSYRFTGEAVPELSVNTVAGERGNGPNDSVSDSNVFVIGKDGERTLKLNTGVIKDTAWIDYLEEIAWAEMVFLVSVNELVPLVLKSNKFVPRVDNEDIGAREFEFVAGKAAVATNILPYKNGSSMRPVVWIPVNQYCMVGDDGRQTGYAAAAKLQLYYSDVQPPVPVKGVALKDNEDGTEGYVPPVLSDACVVGYTEFLNAEISKLGTFKKIGCSSGYTGVEAMITVDAGLFGGATLKAANDLAMAEWNRRNTQAAANANAAGCVMTIEDYTYSVPSGKAHFRWSAMRIGNANADNYVIITQGFTVKGNGWPAFRFNFPDSFVPGTNDIDLPVAFAPSSAWKFGVYGSVVSGTTATIYVNGTVVATQSGIGYFAEISVPHASIPDGARVYVKVV